MPTFIVFHSIWKRAKISNLLPPVPKYNISFAGNINYRQRWHFVAARSAGYLLSAGGANDSAGQGFSGCRRRHHRCHGNRNWTEFERVLTISVTQLAFFFCVANRRHFDFVQ